MRSYTLEKWHTLVITTWEILYIFRLTSSVLPLLIRRLFAILHAFLIPSFLILMKINAPSIIGWICTVLVCALTIFSGVMEFVMPMDNPEVAMFVTKLGLTGLEYYLGTAKLVFAVLFLLPRTTTIGFVFLVGYYGGALATNITHGIPTSEYAPILVVFVLMTIAAAIRSPELLTRVRTGRAS